jgi:hypothetical protein
MTTQTYNPLRFSCASNQATPDYVIYDDFRLFVAYGLLSCWLSNDPDDPNADCNMGRPVDREDVQELRRQFLDLMETVIVSVWRGDYGPGDGEIDGDWQHVYIGHNRSDEDDPNLTVLTWYPRLDADSMMFCLDCSDGDLECIWLSYEGIQDRANVLQVLCEARNTTGTGDVWDDLINLSQSQGGLNE